MRHPFDGIHGTTESPTDPEPEPGQKLMTRRSLIGGLVAAALGMVGLTSWGLAQVRTGGATPTTRRFLEEGGGRRPRPSSHAYYEDGGRPRPTTSRLGEQGGQKSTRPTTQRAGEEGGRTAPNRPATKAAGEEGGKRA
jgi:hypothetical protein